MIAKFFEKNYKLIMVFPLILLIVSLAFIGIQYSKTGDIFERDVSLKGGTSATVYTDKIFEVSKLEEDLIREFGDDVFVRELNDFSTNTRLGYVFDIGEVKIRDRLELYLENALSVKLSGENFSVEEVGSSLGEGFYEDMLKAVLFAFVLMGLVVFIAFRSFIPSIAVIFSVILDISATLMVINLIGLKISAAGIATFLMIIGYSIDTDILMTTRVLKRKEIGSVIERLISSAKTGLTMTATSFVALLGGYIVTNSVLLKQMFLIIMIALVIDVISTYCMNAGILYWYAKRKE